MLIDRPSLRTRVALGALIGSLLCLAAASVSAQPADTTDLEQLAQHFFPKATRLGRFEGTPPAVPVFHAQQLLGYLFFSDDVVRIPAYSGKPIRMLVGFDVGGLVRGVVVVSHAEPILLAGVSESDLAAFVNQYEGKDVNTRIKVGGTAREGYASVDGISGATITAMVMNASITQSVRTVAASRGVPFAAAEQEDALSMAARPRPDEIAEIPWRQIWSDRTPRIVTLVFGLLVLAIILVFQDWLTRHPTFLVYVRTGFLVYTLVFIGWYGLAQLSVINVLTFSHAVVRDFRWDTFLLDPMMFILWSFVALTLLLWGRGVYCGWLCPFGALQELVNKLALRFRVVQLPIPAVVHERLLAIKYIILLGLFGLSLQSMADAVRLAEVEPFKTAINMYFQREWPFVLYALGLVVLSAFNSKFFCKYLCPLGAALTIAAHFRIFDWLRRRKECGRPCQTCAVQCPSQAIRPTGEIDANECHHCLDCQVTFWNAYKCPPLVERRKRLEKHGRELKLKV